MDLRLSWLRLRYWLGVPRRVTLPDFLGRCRHRARWRDLIRRDVCSYCGEAGTQANPITREHVVPRSKGGHGRHLNTVSACRQCNTERGDKPLLLYLLWRQSGRSAAFDRWVVEAGSRGASALRRRARKLERRVEARAVPGLRVPLGELAKTKEL